MTPSFARSVQESARTRPRLHTGNSLLPGLLMSVLLSPWLAGAAQAESVAESVAETIAAHNIRVQGDIIIGYFNDLALLPNTSGRERQAQLMRAVLGVSLALNARWGFLGEYNLANTEIYRDDSNAARFDWYRNLGVDHTYYGNTQAREVYFSYDAPHALAGLDLRVLIGRQFTPVGFHPATLPYWSRIDAPHTSFLANGLFTGINVRASRGGAQADMFYYMGQDHPDRGYNGYGLENDPQVKGNSFPGVALRLMYTQGLAGARARYHLSGHFDKLGSAPGPLDEGKHNDYRMGTGAEFKLPLPGWLGFETLELGGEFMRFRTGLTEDGAQGAESFPGTANLYRNGVHGTAALTYKRWSLRYTQEQLDRGDANILARAAGFDPAHPAMAASEQSRIFSLGYALTDNLHWRFVYRQLDNPFPEASGILAHMGKHRGERKYLSDLRWRF